jgi:acetyltransferase-like isoleucine patch superfamily enzyme
MDMKELQGVMNIKKRPENFRFGIMSRHWARFWMQFAGLSFFGRIAARLAAWSAPPHKGRVVLARMNQRGYIEPTATIYHSDLHLGSHVFIGDRVMIFQRKNGGRVKIGNRVYIYRDTIIETGYGGYLSIGAHSSIHPRCQLNANVSPIIIGSGVMVGPSCAFYSYDHGIAAGIPIRKQPLHTKGGIIIDDDAWLGFGVIVLDGVRIGKGAVIGAGSVVTQDVPDNAIAVGVPARVIRMRDAADKMVKFELENSSTSSNEE